MGIYESLPVRLSQLPNAEDMRRVKELLREHAGEWWTARALCLHTGLPVDNTQVQLRRIITELIESQGCPIVSGHAGFCWTEEANMLMHYDEALGKRQAGLVRRRRAVRAIAYEMDPKLEVQ